MKISRRTFLLSGLGAGLALAGVWRAANPSAYSGFTTLLREQFDYVDFSSADMTAFFNDYKASVVKTGRPVNLKLFEQLDNYMLIPELIRSNTQRLQRLKSLSEDIVSTFIKSTDIMQACAQNQTDPIVKVKYLKFYTPYTQVCVESPFVNQA